MSLTLIHRDKDPEVDIQFFYKIIIKFEYCKPPVILSFKIDKKNYMGHSCPLVDLDKLKL